MATGSTILTFTLRSLRLICVFSPAGSYLSRVASMVRYQPRADLVRADLCAAFNHNGNGIGESIRCEHHAALHLSSIAPAISCASK
jgi:hypothetical protein